MKRSLIIITLLTVITGESLFGQGQRGVRIGYIDMEYILENVPEYQEALLQLESRVAQWNKDIKDRENEIQQMKLNLSNEKVLLTKELIEEREEDIMVKEDQLFQYQQDRFGPNGDLVIQKRQLVQPVQDQVFNAIREISEGRQYDFIFDKSADVVMLYAAERFDISDQVIRMINRAAKREQAENKKEKQAIEQRDSLNEEQDRELTEREKAREERLKEREALMEQRQKERDSIREARQKEAEERRQKQVEERQRRQDSIQKARNKN